MSISMTQHPPSTTFKFKNGYSISIVIGPDTYSSGHVITQDTMDGEKIVGRDSQNAEIAIITPDGHFHQIKGQNDEVIGWVTPERIIEVAYWTSMGDMDAVDKVFEESEVTSE
jgi:hypothetical protein